MEPNSWSRDFNVPVRAIGRAACLSDDNYLKHFRMLDIYSKDAPTLLSRILLVLNPFNSGSPVWIQYSDRLPWDAQCMNLQHHYLRPIHEKTAISSNTVYSSAKGIEGDDPFWAIVGDSLRATSPHERTQMKRLYFSISAFGNDEPQSLNAGTAVAHMLNNLDGLSPDAVRVSYWAQLQEATTKTHNASVRFGAQLAFQSNLQHMTESRVPLAAMEKYYSVEKHTVHCAATQDLIFSLGRLVDKANDRITLIVKAELLAVEIAERKASIAAKRKARQHNEDTGQSSWSGITDDGDVEMTLDSGDEVGEDEIQ